MSRFKRLFIKLRMTNILRILLQKEAFVFRNFNDLLNSNLKNVCMEITSNKIHINQTDVKNTKLFSVVMNTQNFDEYELNGVDKLNIGFNINHLYKIFKILKKKDSLELVIEADNPKELIIRIKDRENPSKVTESSIQVQDMQIIDPELPTGYDNVFNVKSADYQKFIKATRDITSKNIRVTSTSTRLDFAYDMSNIIKRKTTFGDATTKNDNILYSDEFDMKDINKTVKLSNISSYINIYTKQDMPIRLESDIGTFGNLNIYIKSKKMLELESNSIES
jgi:hypothetical protein